MNRSIEQIVWKYRISRKRRLDMWIKLFCQDSFSGHSIKFLKVTLLTWDVNVFHKHISKRNLVRSKIKGSTKNECSCGELELGLVIVFQNIH